MPRITPIAAHSIVQPVGAKASSSVDARERAIARLIGESASPQSTPVQNPSQVSPEEMGALKATSEPRQNLSSEGIVNPPSAPAVVTEAPKTEEPISSQYAILARKEKALRSKVQAQEASTKAREDAIAAKEAQLTAREAEYASKYVPKDQLAQDPMTVLSELGLSHDQITQLMLNGPTPNDLHRNAAFKQIQEELKSIKESQAQANKAVEDRQAQSYQQALHQLSLEAKNLVQADPEFETIHATNRVKDVVELIEKTFKADGVLLSVEEAAREVENHLVEEAIKLARLKKIQSRLQTPATTPVAAKLTEDKKPQTLQTLTNAMGTSRKLSSTERAILAFKGELNKQ